MLRSSVPASEFLAIARREVARRGRLTTFGQEGLLAELPGLPPVDLTIRAGALTGVLATKPCHRMDFGRHWDTIWHRGRILSFVAVNIAGTRLDTVVEDELTAGQDYVIESCRLLLAPSQTVIRFRAPRVTLFEGRRVSGG